jgi:hypothetical protein
MMVNVAITTICDMVDHCRLRLDDVSPIATEPTTNLELIQQAAEDADESELLWSTPELIHYANEAIREVAIRTRCIRDRARNTVDVTSLAVAIGQTEVDIDPRILVINRVWWGSTVMWPESESFLDEASSSWREDETDEPTKFVLSRSGRQLILMGTPTVAGTIGLDVIREPLEIIEAGEPEIPQKYLAHCIHWMCHLAYLKNDADTVNPQLSQLYEQAFTRHVGPRPTELQLELGYHQSGRRRGRVYYY